MQTYIIRKPRKNLVASIMLTILFGPLGLFYSSFAGGCIMTALPAGALLAIFNNATDKPFIQVGMVLGFAVLFIWPISIIWSVISTVQYNKRMLEEENYDIAMKASYGTNRNSNADEDLLEWMKRNPTKSINDYYNQ